MDFFYDPAIRDSFIARYPPYCPWYCITFLRDKQGRVSSFVYRDDEGSGRENLVFKKGATLKIH